MNERRGRFPVVSAAGCLAAWLAFLQTPVAAARDCNGNGSEDTFDVDSGSSRDCNSNGVPDECDVGPGNLLFSEPIEMTLEGHTSILGIAVLEDFTSDGRLDLVSFEPESLLFLRGAGRGEFLPPTSMDIGPYVAMTAVSADTNGDGLRDVVAHVRRLGDGRESLFVLEGMGEEGFEAPFGILPDHADVAGFALANLDGDGAVDIVVANSNEYYASVLWNEGGGSFSPASTRLELSWYPASTAAGDLDGDGDADILTTHFGSGIATFFWNEGGRQFGQVELIPVSDPAGLAFLVDVDRDGDLDVVSSHEGRDTISVALHQVGRAFSMPVTYQIGGTTQRVLAADADGDGSTDLVALRLAVGCDRLLPSLSVLLNKGNGSFIERKDWEIPVEPHALAMGDVDADGLLDAVTTHIEAADPPRIFLSILPGRRGPAVADADADGVPDSCGLDGVDCNWNGAPDARDIETGTSRDCDADGVPDECQPDCDRNGILDSCDIAGGAVDANSNGLLDACESEQLADCNRNGRFDSIDLSGGTSRDCDGNHIPDECDVTPAFRFLSGRMSRISLGATPGGAAPLDFDQDGDLDVAIAMRGSCCATEARGSITLLENLGEGRLLPVGSHAADGDAALVIAIDADGDADPDLLVANRELSCRGPARGALLINDGVEGFRRGEGFVLPSDPAAVAAGDLDRDGDLDLAFANDGQFPATVSLFLNDGRGTFTFARSVGRPGGATAITAGDWNRDGLLDLAAATTGTLVVFTNAGGVAFTPSELHEGMDGIFSVTSADLDRDGDLDLITGHLGSPFTIPRVAHFLNDAGAFAPQEFHVIGGQPRSLLAGDWNGDGYAEVVATGISANVITQQDPGGVTVLLNEKDGTLREAAFFTVDATLPAGAAGDFDGNGTLDLFLTDEAFRAALLVLNEGGGRLAAPLQYRVGAAPIVVVALDSNGDGDQDLAVLNQGHPSSVTLLRNQGKGVGFLPVPFSEGVPSLPRAMVSSDLDGDGDPDLAIASQFKVSILRNDAGAFAGASELPVGSNPFALATSDLDRDGDNDIATANVLASGFRDNVTVFRNEGSGTFAPGRNFVVGHFPTSLVASDMDGDGFEELMACNSGSGSVTVLRNLAGTGFAASAEIPAGPSAFQLRCDDVDGDGDRDFLISGQESVLFLANLGSESFLRGVPVGGFHFSFEPADLDGDGRRDLVLSTVGQLHVLGNRGDGSFAGPTVFEMSGTIDIPLSSETGGGASGDSGPPGASSIAASDLDGDGDLDLALSFLVIDKVVILSNASERAKPDLNQNSIPDECETPSTTVFRRGDAKEDGAVNLTDAIFILRHLFVTGELLSCKKAADSNDDARVDVSDAIAILRFLFLGHDAPSEPFPGCGQDPTPDVLECTAYARCL